MEDPRLTEEVQNQILLHDAWLNVRRFRDGDTLAGIHAYIIFTRQGYSPPEEIKEWVLSNFEKYLETDDTLDSIFDVSQRKKGKRRTSKRYVALIIEIKQLCHTFHIESSDAIWCVQRRLEEAGDGMQDTTVTDIYNRHGSKVSDKKALDEIFKKNIGDLYNKAAIERLLQIYPKDVSEFLAGKMK